jgi:4'-phosphopantetheinyl transferase
VALVGSRLFKNMSSHAAHLAIDWPAPPAAVCGLDRAEVHVWAAALEGEAADWTKILSAAERDRAEAFHFEDHRRRFIVGRGLLRLILGRYLGARAEEVEFSYNPQGKPEVGGSLAGRGLRFNLAHSDELALIAVTRLGPIGVDVERIRKLDDMDELVARFFSAGENKRFQQVSAERKERAFFNLWTRKEAWLKATGEGIAHALNQVEVSFLPGEPARLLALPERLAQGACWSLHELTPAGNFAAALVVAAEDINLHCWRWDHISRASQRRVPSHERGQDQTAAAF